MLTFREKAYASVFFKNGRFQLGQIKITADTALSQKFIEIDFSFSEIFFIKLVIVEEYNRFSCDDPANTDGFGTSPGQKNDSGSINDHGSHGIDKIIFQRGGHFSGNTSDGNAVYIVKHAHLGELSIAHELT